MAGLVAPKERDSVMFPIFWLGVWDSPIPGENADRLKQRERWASVAAKVPDGALAVLKRLQPPDGAGPEGELNCLRALNWLSNTDRHSKLPVMAAGLQDVYAGYERPGGTRGVGKGQVRPGSFVEDDAEVRNIPTDAMKVQVLGTPVVVVRTAIADRNLELPESLVDTLRVIREHVVPPLIPYVHVPRMSRR
jgi:hypothetical protein